MIGTTIDITADRLEANTRGRDLTETFRTWVNLAFRHPGRIELNEVKITKEDPRPTVREWTTEYGDGGRWVQLCRGCFRVWVDATDGRCVRCRGQAIR